MKDRKALENRIIMRGTFMERMNPSGSMPTLSHRTPRVNTGARQASTISSTMGEGDNFPVVQEGFSKSYHEKMFNRLDREEDNSIRMHLGTMELKDTKAEEERTR